MKREKKATLNSSQELYEQKKMLLVLQDSTQVRFETL